MSLDKTLIAHTHTQTHTKGRTIYVTDEWCLLNCANFITLKKLFPSFIMWSTIETKPQTDVMKVFLGIELFLYTLCSTRIPFQDCVCATSQHNTTWTFSFQTFRLFDISLTSTFSHIICVTIRPYSVSMINSCHCRQYLIHIVIHFERSDSSQFLSFYWFLQQGITIKSNIFRVFYDIDKVDIISFGFFFFVFLLLRLSDIVRMWCDFEISVENIFSVKLNSILSESHF